MGTGITNPFLAVATEKGRYDTVNELKADTTLKVNDIVRTIGTNTIDDGISTTYIIKAENDLNKDGKNVQLNNGLFAIHIPQQGSDYKILESGTDCNNIIQPGTYIRQSGSIVLLNAPVNSAGYFIVYSMTEIGTAIFQIFYEAHTHKVYTRSKSGIQWIEWKSMELDESLYSKKVDDYKIEYQNIGNTETSTDILVWARTAPTGFYRSTKGNNLFENLPTGIKAFELTVTGISTNSSYRTITYKAHNSNDIWINTYDSDQSKWLGWSKVLNTSDNIFIAKIIINTKEEADNRFNSVSNISNITGFNFVNNFNTCFPNNLNPQPYTCGILKTYMSDRYIIQVYTPHAQLLDFDSGLYKRIGTKAADSNIITWNDWSYENQQVISNDNGQVGWVKFIDGTLIQTLRKIDISTYNNGTYISFPIAFVGVPSASISDNNNAQNFQIQISAFLTNFALYNVEQRIGHTISITAIGRWK